MESDTESHSAQKLKTYINKLTFSEDHCQQVTCSQRSENSADEP